MFELHIIKDIASWRYGGRTARLSTHGSHDSAARELHRLVRERSLCASAYEIVEVAA